MEDERLTHNSHSETTLSFYEAKKGEKRPAKTEKGLEPGLAPRGVLG